jgi:hypothetical protein
MNAPGCFVAPPTAALSRLAEFLHETGSSLTAKDVAAEAINQ